MDDLIEKSAITAPYIIQAGPIDARQYFLIAEKAHYLEVDHITEAVAGMIGLYYIFNISYPKQWNNCLLFVEKKLLGISSGPKFGPLQAGVVSDIMQMT